MPPAQAPGEPPATPPDDLEAPALRARAAMVTSTFENSTTELQYGYAQNINDGRGITAGRAGFTSGTGDMLIVISRYTQIKPVNALAKYIPALQKVQGHSVTGLAGLEAAWKQEAADARFRSVQDAVVDELYFNPAYSMAKRFGITSALGQAMVWDNCILTGCDYDGNSTGVSLTRARIVMGGNVSKNEAAWLNEFLNQALNQMLNYSEGGATLDPEASTSRISAWRSLLQAKKYNLELPMSWQAYGDTCTIDANGRGGGACS